ncbi:hypothetical protein ACFLSE_08375 [Bacteroidota bacterium]
MKLKYFILIAVFLIIVQVKAQENYRKDWSAGKLTWNDFTENTNENTYSSELKYFLGYEPDKQKFDGVKVARFATFGYIDKTLSWVKPEFKTEQLLKYNQVLFDIVELHRRILQYELDRLDSQYGALDKFNYIYQVCSNQILQFQNESQRGQLIDVINVWEFKIAEKMKSYPYYNIPEFTKLPFGYSLHAGIGGGVFTGSLGEHFSPTFNFMFGFEVAYGNSILFLNGTLAGDNVVKDYSGNENWYKNQSAFVAIIDVSYGYAIIDNKNIKLSPFAGLGITELTGSSQDNEDESLRLVDYNYLVGLNFDYKIAKKINLISSAFTGVKEQVETSIQVKLYVSKANFYDNLNGHSINLTIGLSGFGNFIKLNN